MKKALVFFAVLMLCAVNMASAQRISIYRTFFFSEWLYTHNHVDYWKVGMSGKYLCQEMGGNEAALNEMKKFKINRTISFVFAVPGIIAATWAAYDALQWQYDKTDTKILLIGAPFGIVSIVFRLISDKHIKRAVSIYNGDEEAIHLGLNFKKQFAFDTELISCNLTYSF